MDGRFVVVFILMERKIDRKNRLFCSRAFLVLCSRRGQTVSQDNNLDINVSFDLSILSLAIKNKTGVGVLSGNPEFIQIIRQIQSA